MGRRREHDEETREALRAAAERLFDERGPAAVSVRAVADEVGTSTRAVYSLFGSRRDSSSTPSPSVPTRSSSVESEDHAETDDPAQDLVEMSIDVFRRFVLEHPALYRIDVPARRSGLRTGTPRCWKSGRRRSNVLTAKVQRLESAGVLRGLTVEEATMAFAGSGQGLANSSFAARSCGCFRLTVRRMPGVRDGCPRRRADPSLKR